MTHKCLLNCRQNYRTTCITIVMIARCCLSLNVMNTAGERCFHLLAAVRRNSSISNKITKTVTIRASDVAAVLGRNDYKKYEVVFEEMWKKHSPLTFFGQTKDDLALEAVSKCSPEEKKILATAASYQAADALDARKILIQAEEIIKSSATLSPADKVKVIEHVKSQVYTSHGIRAESKTADLIEEKEGVSLQVDNKLYNYQLCIIDGTRYQISGKVDRIEQVEDDIVLIEIKNRMKKLFFRVPDYEFIQVQTYMQIVPLNIKRTKLIEQYQRETNTIIVERDDMLWKNEILPLLSKFCTDFHAATTLNKLA